MACLMPLIPNNIHMKDIVLAQEMCKTNDGLASIEWNMFEFNEALCVNGGKFIIKRNPSPKVTYK